MAGKKNIWGTVPEVAELQSEGGAAGTMHGALQTGAITTTFTASQGLLLKMPNLYKIAGELTPAVVHVAARTVATHALSIFGDHSDVMAMRPTGVAMLSSNSVQEAMDMAMIAHASAHLNREFHFIHFFDGFRTSHEVQKIDQIPDEVMRSLIDDEWVIAHRSRAFTPDKPVLRGTAQNPDVFFQARETVNSYYLACPDIVQNTMNRFAELTGRQYNLFQYHGPEDAERVIVLMGSGAETVHETVDKLNNAGEKVALIKVRLFRPFSMKHLIRSTAGDGTGNCRIGSNQRAGKCWRTSLQRHDFCTARKPSEQMENFQTEPKVVNGRYGLSSKEFTPPMVKRIFDELKEEKPKNHFTIGIHDDVTHTSLGILKRWQVGNRQRVYLKAFFTDLVLTVQ
jgi:pyruvate-ferredoxin/flavodoxin oxidoreductase